MQPTLTPNPNSHNPHCPFYLLYNLYRIIIPLKPTLRLNPEQSEKNNLTKTRKIVLCTITPITIPAALSLRWQIELWTNILTARPEHSWEHRLLWITFCTFIFAPCGFVLGFLVSGAYYTYHWLKKKRAKRQKTRYGAHSSAPEQINAPFEQRPLVDLKYRDLKELSEPISVVVTPPGGSSAWEGGEAKSDCGCGGG